MSNNGLPAVGIVGFGVATGRKVLTNADLEKMVDTSDEWIRTRTGIQERRIADEGQSTFTMSLEAAKIALERAGVQPAEVDLILVGTVTPDMPFPSVSCMIQDALGCTRAAAADISAACPGFIYAMTLGAQTIMTGLYKTVLVVGAETLSRITDWTDRSTCVLFGDAAGAAVLQPVSQGKGILSTVLGSEGAGGPQLTLKQGFCRLPEAYNVGPGSDKLNFIYMNGQEVFKFATRVMQEGTLQALEKAGLSVADLDLLLPHQANLRIIDHAQKKLGLPDEKVVKVVHKYGNTSSASIPLALEEALQEGRLHDGDVMVMVSFGAGLVWGAIALRWGR